MFRLRLYYICGCVSFKEDLSVSDGVVPLSYESELTELVSRGKLKLPPPELYDLALYLYSFFKNRHFKVLFQRVSTRIYVYLRIIGMIRLGPIKLGQTNRKTTRRNESLFSSIYTDSDEVAYILVVTK